MRCKFITEIEVIDPDSHAPVHVAIFKEDAGGMFGVDSSFLTNTDEPVHSPFGNGIIAAEDL